MFNLDAIIPLDKAMALYIAYSIDTLGTQELAAESLGITSKTIRRYLKQHMPHYNNTKRAKKIPVKEPNQPKLLLTNTERLRMRDEMLNRDRL